MHNFYNNAAASVCALLLLGNACAREESSAIDPPRAQAAERFDAGPELDSSRPEDSAQSDEADAAKETNAAGAGPAEERASAGRGGSRSTRAESSRGGAGGVTSRSNASAGAGGAEASPEAVGGAGGMRSEAGSGAGGARSEAGSEAEGAAGEPSQPDESGDDEPPGSSDAGAASGSGSGEPTDCERIATACAAVAEPSDRVTSCLGAGRASDERACRARIEDCSQACGAPLCQQVLVECPATGAGPVQGCHQIGVTDNAGDCFGDGVKCLEYCREVAAP